MSDATQSCEVYPDSLTGPPEAVAAKNLSLKDGEFFGGYFGWRGGGVEGKPKAFLKSRGGRISG